MLRKLVALFITAMSVGGMVRLAAPAVVSVDSGVGAQLTFLRDALRTGSAEEAQQQFPEGYFFLHALYGLTWVEVGKKDPKHRNEAIREARWVLKKLDEPAGRAPFSESLTPSYGVFYRGWTNWLRGGLLSLQPPGNGDPAEEERFAQDSRELADAFDASPTPYLQAYPGQAWPVDSTVAMASLSLSRDRYTNTKARWLAAVKERLDPRTGLLPHTVDAATGAPTQVARGTSQSMITRFLMEIDPIFGRQQYLKFRDLFVARPLGLGPTIREYPRGIDGEGDVDSGPLVLGTSLSATVVTIGAARVQGDDDLAEALAGYGDFAGFPLSTPWTKRYAFGVIPVGDAFIAWSKASTAWAVRPPPPFEAKRAIPIWWPLPLLMILALIATAPWMSSWIRSAVAFRRARRADPAGLSATPSRAAPPSSPSPSAPAEATPADRPPSFRE